MGIAPHRKVTFRLLLRRSLLELYMDDRLLQCYSLPSLPTGGVGLVFESGEAIFQALKAWEMTL